MKTLFATAALAALVASPVLAQTATPRAQVRQYQPQLNQGPSQEGNVTGQARTCGFPTYQYDSEGTPTGPYCH